jgi:hypothetical protein
MHGLPAGVYVLTAFPFGALPASLNQSTLTGTPRPTNYPGPPTETGLARVIRTEKLADIWIGTRAQQTVPIERLPGIFATNAIVITNEEGTPMEGWHWDLLQPPPPADDRPYRGKSFPPTTSGVWIQESSSQNYVPASINLNTLNVCPMHYLQLDHPTTPLSSNKGSVITGGMTNRGDWVFTDPQGHLFKFTHPAHVITVALTNTVILTHHKDTPFQFKVESEAPAPRPAIKAKDDPPPAWMSAYPQWPGLRILSAEGVNASIQVTVDMNDGTLKPLIPPPEYPADQLQEPFFVRVGKFCDWNILDKITGNWNWIALKDLTALANSAPVVIYQLGGEVRVYSDLDLALFLQTGKFPLGKWG